MHKSNNVWLPVAVCATLLVTASCAAGQQRKSTVDARPAASRDANAGTFRPLFNGRDLTGWQHLGPGAFRVENGLLKTEGGMGLLWFTGEQFGDCVIRVVYRTTDPASNSGVFVRIADKPKDEWFAVHNGYEVQILDRQDEYHRTGAIYSLAKSSSVEPAKPTGEWNTMEITLRGTRVVVHLNGTQINDFDSANPRESIPERTKDWEPERAKARPPRGYIGLQNHDDYVRDKETNVYFREISVRKN